MRRAGALGLLAGWLSAVVLAAAVIWLALGVAIGQVLPVAVASAAPVAIDPVTPRPSAADPTGSVGEGGPARGGLDGDPVARGRAESPGATTAADSVLSDPSAPGAAAEGSVRTSPPEGRPAPPPTGTGGTGPAGGPRSGEAGPVTGRTPGGAPAAAPGDAGPSSPSLPSGSSSTPAPGGPSAVEDGPSTGELAPERVPSADVIRTGALMDRAGQVLISCGPTRLLDWSVLPASGWVARVGADGPTGLRVEFARPASSVVLTGWCQSGYPRFRRVTDGAAPMTPTDDGTGGTRPTDDGVDGGSPRQVG